MIRKKVIYGHSVPYRNMCRYNSGVSTLLSWFEADRVGGISMRNLGLEADRLL